MRYKDAGWRGLIPVAVLALVVTLAAPLGAQDLTVVNTTTVNGQKTQSTQYISPIGTRTGTGDGNEIILRMDQKKMYVLHPAQKTYSEMTFEEMQQAAQTAAKAMDNLPPEAAAQMKKMMGGMGGGEVSVTKVGPGETIAGYATEKYHVVLGSIMDSDIWAAPALQLPPVFYDAMRAATPATPMMDMKKMYDEYKKINGLPLKTVTNMRMMGRSTTTTMIATSVDKTRLPAGTFDVPAGFKPVRMQ